MDRETLRMEINRVVKGIRNDLRIVANRVDNFFYTVLSNNYLHSSVNVAYSVLSI